jgi:hypothetical protein
MSKGVHGTNQAQEPIRRPESVLSIAETITTTTSIADLEDSLSAVTTPRGGSPTQFGNNNPDLPPSYAESQAVHTSYRRGVSFDSVTPGVYSHGAQQVYLYENTNYFSPHGAPVTPNTLTQEPVELPANSSDPGSSALLYEALSFTDAPPPAQSAAYIAHLTRPVGIPALCPTTSTTSAVQFARLYSRALGGASITQAQHASFIDGLNAVSTASDFTAAHLQEAAPFRMAMDTNAIPREEWVRAYIQLCNAKFFQPRGLHVALTTFQELTALAKIPEQRGFRDGLVDDVLDAIASTSGVPEMEDDEGLTHTAVQAAAKLDPYIEPLSSMVPTMSRQSTTLDNVARGLASFSIGDNEKSPPIVLPPGSSTSSLQSPQSPSGRALDKFWNPLGLGPISVGPILPPKLPPSELPPDASWQQWGEHLGRRFEKWGDEYGRQWDQWGKEYGQAWDEWGREYTQVWDEWGRKIQRKATGPMNASRSSLVRAAASVSKESIAGVIKRKPLATPPGAASRESFGSLGSFGSGSRDLGTAEEWDDNENDDDDDDDDDDDAVSVSSEDSLSSDSSVEDPEVEYTKRVVDIEQKMEKAKIEGKRDPAKIERDRESALRKAEEKRIKDEQHIDQKVKRRAMKKHAHKFKRDVKKWKKEFKKDIKKFHKSKASPWEIHTRINAKRQEFNQLREQWENKRKELWTMQTADRGVMFHEARQERREARQRKRDAKQRKKWAKRGHWHDGHWHSKGTCPMQKTGRRGGRHRGHRGHDHEEERRQERQSTANRIVTEESMLWVVIRNLE